MTEFLLLLGKVNLAMGAAIVVVWLLRRPVRAQFGASLAYALWLLVPVAGLASLLPPRTEPPAVQVMAAESLPAPNFAAPMARNFVAPMAQPAAVRAKPAAKTPAAVTSAKSAMVAEAQSLESVDYVPLLFAGWLLGAGLMALYLAWLQIRFYAVARAGEAGPAVAGFWRPRMVMPADFQTQFTDGEQAAILAHERVHLRRQDARINALSALLRALCWFNPLMHLADRWLRMDQELACDAGAMAGEISRRDYARALLKSRISRTRLPLGCNWPGSEHPLVERIALLKRKRPGTARRAAGLGFIVIAAVCAGISAWAAQPAMAGKVIIVAAPGKQVAMTVGPAFHQNAVNASPSQSLAPASIPAPEPAAEPDRMRAQAPLPEIEQSLPEQKIDLALNDAAGPALAKAAADASSSLPDKAIAQEMAAIAATPTAAPATSPLPGKAPRPQSVAALKCLNGLGPEGCEALFEDSVRVRRGIQNCAAEYVQESWNVCPNGPLEALEYLGANTAGDDVFSIKNLSQVGTYVIPPPDADGKIARFCTSGRPPESTFTPFCSDRTHVDSSAVRVTTRPDHALVLYTRPRAQDQAAHRFTGPSVNPGIDGGLPPPPMPVIWPPVPN